MRNAEAIPLTNEPDGPAFQEALAAAEKRAVSRGPGEDVAAYTELIRQFPQEYVPYFRRAVAEWSLGQREQAMRDIDIAAQLGPTEPAVVFFRGMWQLESSAPGPAIGDFERTVDLELQLSSTYYRIAAQFLHAVALFVSGRPQEAAFRAADLPPEYRCFALGRLWTTEQLRSVGDGLRT